MLVSDVPGCGGWQYALEHGVSTLAYPAPKKLPGVYPEIGPDDLVKQLQNEYSVDFIVLAGYLKVEPLYCQCPLSHPYPS